MEDPGDTQEMPVVIYEDLEPVSDEEKAGEALLALIEEQVRRIVIQVLIENKVI